MKSQRHIIDFLFPLILFVVFTLFALTVLLLAAGVYRSTIASCLRNDEARIGLSYLAEKIHQSDAENAVTLGSLEDCDTLILQGEQNYVTYLYCYDGSLRELFTEQSRIPALTDGQPILPLDSLEMEQLQPGLLHMFASGKNGASATVTVGLHCPQKEVGQNEN